MCSLKIMVGGMMFLMCYVNITGWASFFQNAAYITGAAVHIEYSNATIGGNMNISSGHSSDSTLALYGSLHILNSHKCRI